MRFSKIFLSFFVLGIIISMGMTNAFGHGLGYEIMPPEMLGSKLVSLEISSDTWPDKDTKEISFALKETELFISYLIKMIFHSYQRKYRTILAKCIFL
jgi:hypothetical protein